MSFCQTQIDYARLQAPSEDRTALIEPPLEEVAELVGENLHIRGRLGGCATMTCGAGVSPAWAAGTAAPQDYDLHGRWLSDISLLARTELLAAARRWTGVYRNVKGDSPIFADHGFAAVPAKIGTVPEPAPNGLIYLAGHQPQMFHPGVWFKNFVLGELAKRDGATAVNLIIDGDTLSDAALRVPGGSIDQPHAVQVPFDSFDGDIPYEERRIENRKLFASFGQRAAEQMKPLVADPLLKQYWPMVLQRAQHSDNLARAWSRLAISWRRLGDWRRWRFRRVGFAAAKHFSGSSCICSPICRTSATPTTSRCANIGSGITCGAVSIRHPI